MDHTTKSWPFNNGRSQNRAISDRFVLMNIRRYRRMGVVRIFRSGIRVPLFAVGSSFCGNGYDVCRRARLCAMKLGVQLHCIYLSGRQGEGVPLNKQNSNPLCLFFCF